MKNIIVEISWQHFIFSLHISESSFLNDPNFMHFWKTMSHSFIITLYCFTLKWSWVVKFIPCDENWLFGWKSWWGKVQSIRISSLVDLSDNWSNFEFVIYLQCYKDFQEYFSLEVSLEPPTSGSEFEHSIGDTPAHAEAHLFHSFAFGVSFYLVYWTNFSKWIQIGYSY